MWEKKKEMPHDRRQGSLSLLYPSWFKHILHSDFCLESDLQQLRVAEKACFKAGFEVEKKGPCPKLSSRQVMMSESFLLGKKRIPHGPCLLVQLTALL